LIGIAEYSGEKLVQLRNPKAVAEWKGDWGRTSTKWDSVKPEYRDHLKEDGMFYMPFDQFMNFFNDVTINYYDDSYVHTAFRDRINKDTINVYSVVVNTPGEYFFTVSQRDKRSKGTTTGTNGIFLIKIIIF
jgi:Calpain family cysteine protease